MERTEYNRHSRARMAETAKDASRHTAPYSAGRAGAHRPSEALHPTRSSDALLRIARERVPTVPHVAKTHRNVRRRGYPDVLVKLRLPPRYYWAVDGHLTRYVKHLTQYV